MSLDVVYGGTALAKALSDLPGMELYQLLDRASGSASERELAKRKLAQSCGKLCLMWQASEWALEAEQDFWSSTIKEAPVLLGDEAVRVRYHLEAFVLFARSALDIGARAFGLLLPKPFPRGRFDSFNDLTKVVQESGPASLRHAITTLRGSSQSWLSILCGKERGRALRDKISHQTEFPLFYAEIHQGSEKEYAMVAIDGAPSVRLPDFVATVRVGVVDGFRQFENAAVDGVINR